MSKRHYTVSPTGFKCCSCRQEFSSRNDLSKHYGRNGKCKHPIALGMRLDIDVSHYHWHKAA